MTLSLKGRSVAFGNYNPDSKLRESVAAKRLTRQFQVFGNLLCRFAVQNYEVKTSGDQEA
jgi:hypothetical protein